MENEHTRLGSVRSLVGDAIDKIDDGRPEEVKRAIWRLVDAVGLLSELHKDVIGASSPTGRGYQVVDKNNNAAGT